MGIAAYFAGGVTARAERGEYVHAAGRRHCGALLFTALFFAFADDVFWSGSSARYCTGAVGDAANLLI